MAEEPKGTEELNQEVPADAGTLDQPSTAGAVGADSPDGSDQTREGQIDQMAAQVLAKVPENQRESFMPTAVQMAETAYDQGGRIWQSRSTKKMQEAADRNREAELREARIEERERMLQAQQQQRQSQPMQQQQQQQDAYLTQLDQGIERSLEREDYDEVITLKGRREAYLMNRQTTLPMLQEIKNLRGEISRIKQQEEQTRMSGDSVFKEHRDEIEQKYRQFGGNVSWQDCRNIVAANYLQEKVDRLEGSQVAEARKQTAAQKASVVEPPTSGMTTGVSQSAQPSATPDDAWGAAMESLSGDKIAMPGSRE